MTTDRQPVLDRIRKLLNLAQHAGTSEHEASLAAERAAALMDAHEIELAELQVGGAPASATEDIDRAHVTVTRQRVAWHLVLTDACATRFHCHVIMRRATDGSAGLYLFGRRTAVQTATYTAQFLIAEVDRLCDVAAASWDSWGAGGAPGRAWRNAFRLGCAQRIAQRIQAAAASPAASPSAMAIITRDRVEVAEAFARAVTGKLRGRVGVTSNAAGYRAGAAAGDHADLGDGARAGLPAGQRVLK